MLFVSFASSPGVFALVDVALAVVIPASVCVFRCDLWVVCLLSCCASFAGVEHTEISANVKT